MPSRRTVLALLATAPLAGCGGDSDNSNRTNTASLSGRTILVDDEVPFPRVSGVRLIDSVADAELLVLPPSEEHYDIALDALERGTPVVVAGDDAPIHIQRICGRTGQRYGVPSEAWSPNDRIAAAVPSADRLDVQYLVPSNGTELKTQLPWAISEVLDARPPEFTIDDPANPDGGIELGRVRMRGRVEVGNYDRWDRVTLLPEQTRAVVQTVATVDADGAPDKDGFHVSEVGIRTEFDDASIESAGPETATLDTFSVEAAVGKKRSEATHTFSPASDDARQSMTVGARTVVSLPELAPPFGYIGNVKFAWRRGRFLREDESWVAHTPGWAVWRGFEPTA
ncbi:hypothetical protein [Halogeometricum borinquense]|uniref:hypothetical protein n=1 Tax=Halogeometricum borinquense TaxID=60847 RepID=UPI003441E4CD